MPKYQIILDSDEILTDQEFQQLIQRWFSLESWNATDEELLHKHFKFSSAQNLEGIRKELYENREELKEGLLNCNMVSIDRHNRKEVDESFDEVSKLFKLD